MQIVLHEYRNQSRIFNMLESLYSYISDTDSFEDVLWLDTSFKDVNDILQQYLLVYRQPRMREFSLPKISNVATRKKEITVCLSGGKDSAACAFYYKSLGYKVHLYHAANINKAYGDEKTAAKRIADYLGCDLFTERIQLKGHHRFIEHPLKNYIIANGAIHYCLAMGYAPVIAFGNFNQARLDTNPFEVCGGDCIEMWGAYKKIIHRVIPNFDIRIPLATNADTFRILEKDWKLFELSVSCMSPFRFRAFWKHRCEEQYNIRLFENRCGVCWKCCIEEMWLMDTGKMEYLMSYYMHCISILTSTIYRETGHKPTYEEIWNNYMWYPIEQSKAFGLLPKVKFRYTSNGIVHVRLDGERVDAPISASGTEDTK